jgi:ubiquinone/menaquinone biosynthesis C-methylase UbiE
MGFFTLQGVTGLLSARTSSAASGEAEGGTGRRLEKLVRGGATGPIAEALATYAQDFENIKAGLYKMPWDMTTPGHRQYNPLFVLRKAVAFVREAADTLGRRDRQADTSVWLDSRLYPDYYRNTFHYQTDGWMSKESADIYESSTETLFLGKQDAMQRQTLVPLHHHMRGRANAGAGMKLLEVACGTGRFATFVKDNYPEMDVTCLDLSPYYLANARDNLKYWRQIRAPASQKHTSDTFIQAAAEDISADDNSYDVVTCIYLFHELPEDVRRKAAAEMARVCKPGGLVVLTDSVQYGDRECFDATLGAFSNFNEPYYQAYISTDLGKLFEDAGLQPHMKTVASSTKALSFKKPLTPPSDAATASPPPAGDAVKGARQPTAVMASIGGNRPVNVSTTSQ